MHAHCGPNINANASAAKIAIAARKVVPANARAIQASATARVFAAHSPNTLLARLPEWPVSAVYVEAPLPQPCNYKHTFTDNSTRG